MSELSNKATKSVFWSAIERFSVQFFQLALTIIIARVLSPKDYGLIAMLGVFMAIAQTFIDSGFANALIQKKNRNNTDYCTVFYFNIVISVIVYILLFFSAPLIASFYIEPELVNITRIFGLTVIINSFGLVQQAKLTIQLDFKRLAKASLIAVVASGIIGVYLAYTGFGVWALVAQTIINNGLRVLFIWIYAKWHPILIFSKESFTQLFSFGSKLLASSLLHTIYVNIYTLIIGKFFSASTCGLYNQAFKLSSFPSTNLTSIIVRAVYPIQCQYQDDNVQLKDMFVKYLRMSCFIIFPIMILFASVAKPFVILFLGEQWAEAVPLLQILCIAYMWDPLMKISNSMLNVKGRSDLFLRAEIYKKISAFIILFATIPFGITAMCFGILLYSFVDIIIITYYLNKVLEISLLDQIKLIFDIVILAILPLLTVIIINCFISNLLIVLISSLISYTLVFFILSYLFKNKELNKLLFIYREYVKPISK